MTTLNDRKVHVQLCCCGPHAIDLLAMKFVAALCYFASSCLCKIGLEIWQLMRTVQQNKRVGKSISRFIKSCQGRLHAKCIAQFSQGLLFCHILDPCAPQTQAEGNYIRLVWQTLQKSAKFQKLNISDPISISANVPSLWNKCGLHYLIVLMPSLIKCMKDLWTSSVSNL